MRNFFQQQLRILELCGIFGRGLVEQQSFGAGVPEAADEFFPATGRVADTLIVEHGGRRQMCTALSMTQMNAKKKTGLEVPTCPYTTGEGRQKTACPRKRNVRSIREQSCLHHY